MEWLSDNLICLSTNILTVLKWRNNFCLFFNKLQLMRSIFLFSFGIFYKMLFFQCFLLEIVFVYNLTGSIRQSSNYRIKSFLVDSDKCHIYEKRSRHIYETGPSLYYMSTFDLNRFLCANFLRYSNCYRWFEISSNFNSQFPMQCNKISPIQWNVSIYFSNEVYSLLKVWWTKKFEVI